MYCYVDGNDWINYQTFILLDGFQTFGSFIRFNKE